MPVYNGQEYLPQALDALIGQTFDDFEIIISDNVSTDATESICRAYAARDSRIRYLRRTSNIGATRNFNAVFQAARGEYFKWASHDDLCAPTFLERCVAVLDGDSTVEWCHPRSTHIDAAGRPLALPGMANVSYGAAGASSDAPSAKSLGINRESHRASDRFRAVLLGHGGCLDSYGLIRTTAIHRTHLYLPYFGSEKVFIAELALLGRFREIPDVLFYPRVHPQRGVCWVASGRFRTYCSIRGCIPTRPAVCRAPRHRSPTRIRRPLVAHCEGALDCCGVTCVSCAERPCRPPTVPCA